MAQVSHASTIAGQIGGIGGMGSPVELDSSSPVVVPSSSPPLVLVLVLVLVSGPEDDSVPVVLSSEVVDVLAAPVDGALAVEEDPAPDAPPEDDVPPPPSAEPPPSQAGKNPSASMDTRPRTFRRTVTEPLSRRTEPQ